MNRKYPATKENVKITGRHLYDGEILWLTSSAASIEFEVNAGSCCINLKGDQSARIDEKGLPQGNCVRYSILVNNKLYCTECVAQSEVKIDLSSAIKSGLSETSGKPVTISFVKITESSQSYVGIESIEADGEIKPAAERKLKIEFIGDSITCGYGIESKDENESFSTLTENVLKTYGAVAANNLDADFLCSSYSSFGVHSGWTDSGDMNDYSLVPRIYDNVCFSWNTQQYAERKWDFSLFTPDLVVFNLGTNDMSYCKGDKKPVPDSEKRCEDFCKSYVNFLKHVRSLYPHAEFLLSIGIMEMGDCMTPYVEKTVSEYKSATGDEKIHFLHFNTQRKEEGYGSGFHPNETTQKRCGEELTAYIKHAILHS